VPGDVVEIPLLPDTIMPCDFVLLTGTCIVNESMLTGESIPVIKSAIPVKSQELYDPDVDTIHTIYGGTKVIQTRKIGNNKVFGLVIRTGYVTSKGNLIRDILYPRANKFKFYEDSLKFIFVMGIIAVVGFMLTLKHMIE
jgi:cation-transporting ATPase 13A3/4/5